MSSPTPSQACLNLSSNLSDHPPADAEFKTQHELVISSFRDAADNSGDNTTGLIHALGHLAEYFHKVSHHQHLHNPQLATLLADTTRQVPFWRPLFGLSRKPNTQQNRSQSSAEAAPDCVLEVARRIVTLPWHDSRREQVRSALRIIANCCADNNVNRSIIFHRGGVEFLMDMARDKRECDLIIPTLYNVCVDYDELAVDNEGKPWGSPGQMKTGTPQDSGLALNAAEQKLGMYWDAIHGYTSVEILLATKESAETCLGTLADLVEMASRVALYGVHHLVRSLDADDTVKGQATGCRALVRSLLMEGADMAQDPDCRVSICQAVCNVLSQRNCWEALIEDDGAIWRLIHLPYPVDDEDQVEEDDDDAASLAPYREVFLKLVYEISALEAYGDKFGPESPLIRDCTHALRQYGDQVHRSDTTQAIGPWDCICVLLANGITSTDRAVHLLESSPIAFALKTLIADTLDSDILLPAVDLATRLALCRAGQDALHEAGMMSAVHRVLNPTSETDAVGIEIQRETVTLVRLLVKGRAEYLGDLSLDTALHEDTTGHDDATTFHKGTILHETTTPSQSRGVLVAIMALFKSTTDTRTKTEIGRLSIEVLRILFSSASTPQPTKESQTSASSEARPRIEGQSGGDQQHNEHLVEGKLLSLLSTPDLLQSRDLTIADAMAYIIIQPRPQTSESSDTSSATTLQMQAEGEAWFGLALLANLPVAQPWILAALGRNDGQLLKGLRDIVAGTSLSLAQVEGQQQSLGTAGESNNNANETDTDTNATTGIQVSGHDHDHDHDHYRELEMVSSANATSSALPEQIKSRRKTPDPRYENVKVLVLRLLSSLPSTPGSESGSALRTVTDAVDAYSPYPEEERVIQGLKAAAAELGFR